MARKTSPTPRTLPRRKPQIVIEISGGVLTGVRSRHGRDVQVTLVDYDNLEAESGRDACAAAAAKLETQYPYSVW